MSHVIGIDLGTTNSCVAAVRGTAPEVLTNKEGSRTTASIVAFAEDGERLVGQIAKRQAITNPQNTVFAVKRLVGRKFDDEAVQNAQEILPYQLARAANGDVKLEIRGREYSPQEISAFILEEIRAFAEEALGGEVSEAVITVPAYFDDSQRQATKDAGKIAGLEVARIINEPTAAALAYGLQDSSGDKTIAVYDLGGGTFDVSILELTQGVFEVRATAGDSFLGGEDFDNRIMDWLIDDFAQETGVDLKADRMALQRLKEAAERAKCELSTNDSAEINLPFISTDESGPRHLAKTLTREAFEGLVRELVEATEGPCRDALAQADLRPDQIDEVLLVGGQTRSPLVSQVVERVFGRAPNRTINPDEVVAVGAAIQGGILGGDVKDMVLLDVTPLSLGIETHGGLFTRLIARNSTIPTQSSQVFTTVQDNQDTVEVHVLQGERDLASENRSLGRFELVGIPPAPRGVPQIEVTFAIDSNGIVNVSARDVATDKSQSIEITPAGGLSTDEIDHLVEDAEAHRKSDAERKEIRRLQNRLEGMIQTNERVLEQFGKMLGEDEHQKIHQTLLQARVVMGQDDRKEIEATMSELNGISSKLSELMLNP